MSLLSVDEPPGGKDRGPLDGFLPRVRETSRHQERELAHTGGAVPRNDVSITPFHHASADLVSKLDGVDQEAKRSRPLGLPREEAERRHEPAVAHARGGRQPAQLQNVILGPDHDSPRVLRDFVSHERSSMAGRVRLAYVRPARRLEG